MKNDLASVDSKRFLSLTNKFGLLKLDHFKKLAPGHKLSLGVFNHDSQKFEKFSFKFEELKPVKGPSKKFISQDILGQSKYLNDLSMFVERRTGEIRIVLSSDISAVFLLKPIIVTAVKTKVKSRPSPSESATLFSIGTKKRGGNGKIWAVKVASNRTKRWVRVA